jgi:tetratricopeptide (TPR) repeat protein
MEKYGGNLEGVNKLKKWKVSLGILVSALAIILAVVSLNNKQTNKVPANTQQSTSTAQNQNQNQIVDPNAAKFEGQANLKKYEDLAQKNSSSPIDQVNAAVSAYVNQDYNKAIEYYKKAVALQPKNAQYLTYLGNVYFRGLNNPKEASRYYEAATQNDPRYVYGWWNLAICEKVLGDKEAAKATLQKGIASVDPRDPLSKQLQLQLDAIK